MSDNHLNKRFFTEADSPVPLIPADMAWDNMRKKLDPEEKKRRFIIWIPPFAWTGLGILLTGVASMIWWTHQTPGTLQVKNKNTKHAVLVRKEPGNASRTIKKEQPAGITINKPEPTLTANNKNRSTALAKQAPDKRRKPVMKNATGREDERSLPFAFPERVLFNDTILVQAHRPSSPLFSKPQKEDSVHKAVWVEAGLHWNVPVPVNGNEHYLLGPNGKQQPHQFILPGIWLSVNQNKQRLILSANPFVSAPLPEKYYGKGMAPLNDSMIVDAQKRMIKMFGFQASLQYGYKLTDHWWLGGGINANWWRKGLVYARPADSNFIFKPFLYSVNTKAEADVTGFQLSANASLSYQFRACEAIIHVNAPFTETIKKVQSPLWVRFGVRWRLLKKQFQPPAKPRIKRPPNGQVPPHGTPFASIAPHDHAATV